MTHYPRKHTFSVEPKILLVAVGYQGIQRLKSILPARVYKQEKEALSKPV
jgi:hypothetical protein